MQKCLNKNIVIQKMKILDKLLLLAKFHDILAHKVISYNNIGIIYSLSEYRNLISVSLYLGSLFVCILEILEIMGIFFKSSALP